MKIRMIPQNWFKPIFLQITNHVFVVFLYSIQRISHAVVVLVENRQLKGEPEHSVNIFQKIPLVIEYVTSEFEICDYYQLSTKAT